MSGDTSANSFSCSEYGIVCDSTQALSHHMSTANHSPYCCSMCDKRCLTKKGLNDYLKMYTGYSCPVLGCKEVLESSVLLQQYKIVCACPYAYTMVGCNSRMRRFATQGGLEKHLKKHDRYPCTVLDYTEILESSALLQEHEQTHGMSKKHKKSFLCNQEGCNKSFSREDHLKKHRNKHTGKRFPCSKCERDFSAIDNLRQHEKKYHQEK